MPYRAVLKCLCLLQILLSTPGMAASSPPAQAFSDGYVAQESCSGCHQAEANAWAGSHHSWSLREAREGNVLGDFNDVIFNDGNGIELRFYRRGDRVYVNAEDEQGKLTDFVIAYTFGFYPLQQYLIERPGGRLQSLTVAWDSRPQMAGGQRWFSLYPGQRFSPNDALHWTGRYQNWNAMCADCHSGNLRKGYDAAADTYQTTWSEMAVGCQSCHGPGQRHIDWATKSAQETERSGPDEKGLAVDFHNSQKGYLVEQCARCHSRRQPLGNGGQPGKPLLDAMRPAVLSAGLYHADGQILDEVFEYGSFTQSKMFNKGVTCSNCHEPHTTKLRAEGNDLCKACHNPAGNPLFPSLIPKNYDNPAHHHHVPGSQGAQCVNCHMPTRTYMGVDERRDHALRIPRPDLDAQTGSPDACTGCHKGETPAWAAQALAGWNFRPPLVKHYGEVFAAARRNDPEVLPQLAKLITDTTQPAIVRATAVELGASYGSALDRSFIEALKDDSPEVRLQAARSVEAHSPTQRLEYLLPLLRDPILAVRDQAARGLADYYNTGLQPPLQDLLSSQLADHEQRLARDADLPVTRVNLAILQERLHRPEDAKHNYRQALVQDARFVPARTGLVRLLVIQGQTVEAEQLLRAGLASQPQQQELILTLGLLLAQQGNAPEAIEWLQRADTPRAHYNLGLLLSRMGRQKEAKISLLRGLEQDPANQDLRYTLAYLSAQNNELDDALKYCEGSNDMRCQRLSDAIKARGQ
ncbi:doubled CXXCH domain-containing protein [Pseudomonas sp. NFACC23-1]|nr:doubled CXXCH domain-containing protein [Pseudomonas sp. NFACC17-2]SEI91232.1 doubled CXXCH domain-containing protein [Pseudomonas sp. NFACC23-1]SFW18192.1 doubled CXXCH domain-containing protein [Pseudomonas sp. NFACC16-2]